MDNSDNIISKRFFIAIPLSDLTNKALNPYCEHIATQHSKQRLLEGQTDQKIRFTPESKRHMTLAFLGALNDDQIEAVRTILHKFKHPATTLKLTTISRFPDPQSKIITALPAPSNKLNSLHARLQQSLEQQLTQQQFAKNSSFLKLSRPYRPHISLTRIKNLEDDLPIAIEPPIDIQVSKIVLYESQITEAGSHYTPIETTDLLSS